MKIRNWIGISILALSIGCGSTENEQMDQPLVPPLKEEIIEVEEVIVVEPEPEPEPIDKEGLLTVDQILDNA